MSQGLTRDGLADVVISLLRSARTGKIVRQVVSDFALVCRGLDGSAYGAASASAF